MSELHFNCPEKHSWIRKIWIEQCESMVFFRFPSKNTSFVSRETFSTGFLKLLSSCLGELPLAKLNYHEKILLLTLSVVLWAETYQTFGKKFLAELLRQHFLCPNRNFEGKIFLSEMILFMNILRHWAKMCWFLAKNVRHGCQSCILCVEENFWLKVTWFTKIPLLITFSGLWMETFRALRGKIWGTFFKKAFHMSREMIRGKLFCWRPIFLKISKSWFNIFSYLRKNFRSVMNTAFYMPRGAFSDFWKKNNFFSSFWAKTFQLFVSRLFGMVVKNLFLVSRKTCWGKCIVSKKRVLIFFWSLSGRFSDFWRIL